MFYPFPRAARVTAPPCGEALAAPPVYAAPPPPPQPRVSSPSLPSSEPSSEAATSSEAASSSDEAEPELELDDALVAVLARSAERRAKKAQDAAQSRRTFELPETEEIASRAVQAERRRQQLLREQLYGPRLPEVRALEARLNQAFDHIAREQDPPLWPSAPLRG